MFPPRLVYPGRRPGAGQPLREGEHGERGEHQQAGDQDEAEPPSPDPPGVGGVYLGVHGEVGVYARAEGTYYETQRGPEYSDTDRDR